MSSYEIIYRESSVVSSLIDEMFLIMNIDSGKLAVFLQPVELADVIQDVLEDKALLIEEKNLSINVFIPREIPVLADRNYLYQSFFQIIENAIVFNHTGGQIEIFISGNEPGFIEIAVSDTGMGVDEAVAQTLFEKFTRSPVTDSYAIEGTGTGLFIASRLIQAMGGRLRYEPNRAVGTTFYVTLRMQT